MVPQSPNDPNQPDRVEELGTYEMIWDCKFCGNKNLPAKTHKFCPTCGAAQDPQTRRFPSDEEKIAVKEHVSKGASLICPACGTPNDGDSQFCMQCGGPLDQAARAQTVGSEVRAESQSFVAGQERDLAQERMAEDLPKAPAASGSKINPLILIAGAVVLLLICGGLIFALTAKRDATATVVDHNWQRIVYIDQFTSVRDNAWDDQVPSDAYSVSCSERQRSSRQVPDGEECSVRRVDNGDGTFSERRECNTVYREEPIYDDYCSYSVNRWIPAREVQSSNVQAAAPFWPSTSLTSGNSLGAERESGRDERYIVYLDVDGRRYECEVNQRAWEAAQDGETFNISIGVVTNAPDCSALEQ